MKKKKMMILSSLLVASLALSACGKQAPPVEAPPVKESKEVQQEKGKEEKSKEDILKQRIQEQDDQIKAMQDELDYYREYVKEVALILPADKMQELIEKEWNYSLTINQIAFPKNGILEIGQTDFELTLKEEQVPYSVLPEEESMKGKIKNAIERSIKVEAPKEKLSNKKENSDKLNTIIYSFKGLTSDDVIKIKLSEELMKKLEMSTPELEIRIVK